jgi:hypothetical protein
MVTPRDEEMRDHFSARRSPDTLGHSREGKAVKG